MTARMSYNSFRTQQRESWFNSRPQKRPIVNYDQHGNIFHGFDENNVPIVQDSVTGQMRLSPSSRNVGATPYAQPQNNKGANPASDQIRAGWGWGDSQGDAGDDIKAGWGRQRTGNAPVAPVAGNPGAAAAGIGNAAGWMAQGGVPGGVSGVAAGAAMSAAAAQGQQAKGGGAQTRVVANKSTASPSPANGNAAGASTAQMGDGISINLPDVPGGISGGGD